MSASNSATIAPNIVPSGDRQPPRSAVDVDRRTGLADRRQAGVERRNADRITDELEPRRNPDTPDRRS